MNLADNLRRMQLAPAPRCDKTSREDAHRLAQVQTGMLLQRTASGNMRTPRLESPRPSTEDRREKIVIEAVEENGSWTDINHAMVASGVSDDFTPPGHLCPAGHTGDAGSERYISHSGGGGERSEETREEKKARRARRAAKKRRNERRKQREKEKEEDAKEGLRSVKGAANPSTATWIALAESVSGDGVDGPIVTVVPTLA
jgi:hypothetical protein